MSAEPTAPAQGQDPDQQETREWTDALSSVIEQSGPARAHFLIGKILSGPDAGAQRVLLGHPIPVRRGGGSGNDEQRQRQGGKRFTH